MRSVDEVLRAAEEVLRAHRAELRSIEAEVINWSVGMMLARTPGLSRQRALAHVRVAWHLMRLARLGGSGASFRDLQRANRGVAPAELRRAVREAVASGQVAAIRIPSGAQGGRPKVVYCWAVGHNPAPSRG